MKKNSQVLRWKLIFPLLLLFNTAFSQDVYKFTEGLLLKNVHKYGREALYTDLLAYQLFTNTLKPPTADAVFGTNSSGEEMKWLKVSVDTAGRFRTRSFNGGYIYLTYNSDQEKTTLLNIKGNSAVFVNGVLHAGDPYSSGWMYVPVNLKKGLNEFYVRGQNLTASLIFSNKPILLNTEDATLPSIVNGDNNNGLKGAVVVINSTQKELTNYSLKSNLEGKEMISVLAPIPAMSTRKVIFQFNGEAVSGKSKVDCKLYLINGNKTIDENKVIVEIADPSSEKYMNTFVSSIDGSLQYYAVAPKTEANQPGSALFFSVHGAGVEAIGQARAYQSKDWGNLVAPTNRRPRGFNWEDWGRLDALEVLQLAKDKFKPNPQRIYLTGHSMGGHGTWFLGATYPDNWAGIAPCAGYPTLKGYGSADGLIPDSSSSAIGNILLSASNQSDVFKLKNNYKSFGVYILHGDADRTVSVNYARSMKKTLAEFHQDFSYYEYPNGSHWYGNESVDWNPLFEYFKWHNKPVDTAVNTLDFTTASPGISASYYWATIHQQTIPLQYSRIQFKRDKNAGRITGSTQNVRLLKISLKDFSAGKSIAITLDSLNEVNYITKTATDEIYLQKESNSWQIATAVNLSEKGPHRYGTFKDGFNKKMVFVYSTVGTKEENDWSVNKARFDAETWYYRGNGAVDIIADKVYSLPTYKDRNVVIYGNENTNSAWKLLLKDCPVQVSRNTVKVGGNTLTGDDLAAYFVWPIKNTESNTVSVIAGSGLKGMNAALANQYFAGGSGFPDYMVYRLAMLKSGIDEVKVAGYFDYNWKIK
ncbi:prolyl oligopeptidase family serine peptidase [Pedobacter foliorum]|uniref:prolyl oligopeptidase family serine peptidase n=1 Tax=Pedobacter foliorum TaxID=2739058 RepID=UPI0015673EDD|nr:alpha/beta hydrolase-fold protein [Pedobacter foliorum]NRF37364.1 prolyl oligopeptidase family serine peptidase [Pedobacter foliorum]